MSIVASASIVSNESSLLLLSFPSPSLNHRHPSPPQFPSPSQMAELSIPTWPSKKKKGNTGHVHFASTPESYIDKLDDGIKQLALVKKLTLNEVAGLARGLVPNFLQGP
ncbi:hypothetical protein OROMI_013916 [Orobanche minor]